jgi:hypothetical protein
MRWGVDFLILLLSRHAGFFIKKTLPGTLYLKKEGLILS